jgi:radical SAM protein with 4Fe4S-binding SPASM domain
MVTFEVDWHNIPVPPENIFDYYRSKQNMISRILQDQSFSLNDMIDIDEENQFKIVNLNGARDLRLKDGEVLQLTDVRLVGCSYFRLYGQFDIVKKKKPAADVNPPEPPPSYRKISSAGQTSLAPVLAIWTVTNRCNLDCSHCYYYGPNISHTEELDTENALRVIHHLGGSSLRYLSFSGGEPLVRNDILPLMVAAREAGLKIILDTNATLITSDMALKLAEIGITAVIGSLDGNRRVHESFRGNGTFDRVLEAVNACREQDIYVAINTVVNRENIGTLEEIAQICSQAGVNVLKYENILPAGRAHSNTQLLIADDGTGMEIYRKIDSIREAYGTHLPIISPVASEAFLRDYSFRCLSGKSFISISSNGNIAPCPSLCFIYEHMGDEYSLVKHWLSDMIQRVDFRPAAQLPRLCQTCIYGEACLSGCMTRSYYYNHNMLSVDPLCIEKRRQAPPKSIT